MYNIVKGDLTKIDNIEKKKMVEVLNWLSLIKDKDMYEDK